MQLAVSPTVFIALGGTGQEVLAKLRQRLEHRVGTADLPFFRYVYVDTHQQALDEAVRGIPPRAAGWSRTNTISPTEDTIVRLQNPRLDNGEIARKLDIDQWFDPQARHELGTVQYALGVGGRRMYSRLGFLSSQNLGSLEDTLIEFYNQLITCSGLAGRRLEGIDPPYLNAWPRTVEQSVRFVVVASSGGGTGSGCFIDFGFLLRKIRGEQNWGSNSALQLGHVILARGIENPNHYRNTAGLLTELDHYDGTQTYEARYLNLEDSPSYKDRNPPYDVTYVVAATQQNVPLDGDQKEAFTLLQWKVADYLITDAVAVYDDPVSPTDVKLPRASSGGSVAFLGDIGLNPSGLQTYGVGCREWPAALVHRQVYGNTLRSLTKTWGQPQARKVAEVEGALRDQLGLPLQNIQENNLPRDPNGDRLKDLLLAPITEIDPVSQLNRLEHEAYDDRKRVSAAKLGEVQNQVKRLFQVRTGAPTSSGQAGAVYGIIHTNLAEAISINNPAGLMQQVGKRLLQVCVDSSGGPATAAQVARQLRSAARREADFITQALEEVNPTAPDRPHRLTQCWQFANDSLLQEVLTAKRSAYQELEGWLSQLEQRFAALTAYIQEWAAAMQADAGSLPHRVPSLVIPPAVVQRLEMAANGNTAVELSALNADRTDSYGRKLPGLLAELRNLIEAGLPRTDDAGRPTLLAEGPPKVHGSTDFSYLDALGRAVYEGIGNGPASPYNEEVLTLLQTEAANSGRTVDNLARETELLVNFKRSAEYNQQRFSGNPTHFTQIVNPEQAGYPAFSQVQSAGKAWLASWRTRKEKVKEVDAFTSVSQALNRYTATYVAERCSIATDHLTGYSREQRRAVMEQGHFPACSDRRIKLPPDPAVLENARVLLIGSLVLKQWTYLGGTRPYHQMSYHVQDNSGQTREKVLQIPNSFPLAVRGLAENTEALKAIELTIQRYLQSENAGAAADAVETAARLINEPTQQNPPQISGNLLQYNLHQVPLEDALEALMRFARRFKIPQPEVPHPYAVFRQVGTARPGSAAVQVDQEGWYCTRCGLNLGFYMPVRTGSCIDPACNNPYAPEGADVEGVR